MPEQLLELTIDQLMPDPNQPRKTFLQDEIERLAASMIARGVLTPLRVMQDAERQLYLIATGESRFRAAKLAGLKHLPCIVIDGKPDEADLLADRIIENHCRRDLRPLELARALAKLKALKKCTSQALAAELGISGAAITRAESLLSLPEAIQDLVDSGQVPESAAYEISRLPDEPAQHELAQSVAAGRMKRDAVAEAVRNRIGRKQTVPKASRLACKLDGGISITVSAGQPLTWDELLSALDHIRKQARKLCDGGKEVTALAKSLQGS
jgi:ParB family chromosome partitioning protein